VKVSVHPTGEPFSKPTLEPRHLEVEVRHVKVMPRT
jgi:hypothetical protein